MVGLRPRAGFARRRLRDPRADLRRIARHERAPAGTPESFAVVQADVEGNVMNEKLRRVKEQYEKIERATDTALDWLRRQSWTAVAVAFLLAYALICLIRH